MSEKPKEYKFKEWPGNKFDFNDKELFQIHENLCDDLELSGYTETEIVNASVGIWAGLKFAQDFKSELQAAQARIAELEKKLEVAEKYIFGNDWEEYQFELAQMESLNE